MYKIMKQYYINIKDTNFMKHLHLFKQTLKTESEHKRFRGNLFSAFLKCGIIVMLCLMSFSISAQTQTPLQVRIGNKNNPGKDTLQIATGNRGIWYVIKKQDLNGVRYAFLISYYQLYAQNAVYFGAIGGTNMDYATSNLRTRMNAEYSDIPGVLKDIAVVANLGNATNVNDQSFSSSPTSEMAGYSPASSKYVLFAPSFQEVLDWNKSLGCNSSISFCPAISRYHIGGSPPNGRWWTRSTDALRPTTHKFEVNPEAGALVGIEVSGGNICMVGGIWVKYDVIRYSVSGTVSGLQNNVGVQVCYKINNGSQQCVTTTAGGAYKISDIPTGSNIEIIPSVQPDYTATLLFTPNPMNVTANLTGKNIQYSKQTYNVHGTVFPFVYTANEAFDTLFTVTAELYSIPQGIDNALLALLKATPVQKKKAVFYDGTIFVETTPLHPGDIGATNNPGLPIDWEPMGYTPDIVDRTPVTQLNNHPDKPVGLYTFDNVVEGNYIIILSAPGFVTRYAKIHIGSNDPLGHRELVAGDFNDDGLVDQRDATLINEMQASYPSAQYNPKYDLNGDKQVDATDISFVVNFNFGFSFRYYKETWGWLFE
jgi:uncharacterized membrane protein